MGAVRAADPGRPTVFVNAGQWLDDSAMLDGRLRPDATERNRWMVAGLQQVGLDAANASIRDLPALSALGTPPTSTSCPRTSRERDDAARRIDAGGLTIASRACPARPGPPRCPASSWGTRPGQPRDLRALRESADLVVLLTYADPKAAHSRERAGRCRHRRLRAQRPICAHPRRGRHLGRSHAGTERLGELRLWREEGVWQAVDRKVELDDVVPARPDEAASQGRRDVIEAVEQAAFGALPKR